MRPCVLQLNNFGPFLGKHEIDFTKFDNGSIFLITGDTGAGKTTIFDAIVYALYGKASGNFRTPDDFKSQYANEDDLCYVELSFLLRDKHYTVYREPARTVKTRNGTERVIPSNAKLTLDNGEIITGVGDVQNVINEILGLSDKQFKQTVMLAQGEFRAMLEAGGHEKQEIFRRIFNTYLYQTITEKLKQLHDNCKEEIKTLSIKIHEQLLRLNTYTDETLACLISAPIPQVDKICERLNQLKTQSEQQLEILNEQSKTTLNEIQKIDIESAVKLNADIELLSNTNKQIDELNQKESEISSKREQLKLFSAASKIMVEEKFARDYKQKSETDTANITKTSEDIKLLEQKLSQYSSEDTINKEIENEALALEKIGVAIIHHQQINTYQTEKDECERKLKTLTLSLEYLKTLSEIQNTTLKIKSLKEYKTQTQLTQKLTQDFENQKQVYLNTLSAFLDNSAGILAQDLKENTPCPVCGSLTHPQKATLKSNLVTQLQVDEEKSKQEDLILKLQTQKENVAVLKMELENLLCEQIPSDIDDFVNTLENSLVLLTQKADSIKTTLSQNFNPTCLSQVQEKLNETASQIEKAEETVKIYNDNINTTTKKLPCEYADYKTVLSLKEAVNKKLSSLKQALDEITAFKQQLNVLNEKINNLKTSQKENHEKYLDIRQRVKEAIANNGFENYDHYKNFVVDEEKIKLLETQISNHENQKIRLHTQQKLLFESVGGKQTVNVTELEQKLAELKENNKLISDQIHKCKVDVTTFSTTFNSLTLTSEELGEKEKRFQNVSNLFNVAKGENSQRIDFERYVLSTYFDDILVSANKRFSQMTSQRYQMYRKHEKGKGRAAQGLEIEILDSNTGLTRAVSSLSGGESFKASLSLALGLGDVVQSYAGGIVIDTMFIDEGFGTLDQTSLSSAIQCLSDLNRSTSRTIGIISHVSELKERIPSQIKVKATSRGSQIELTV